MTGYTETQTKDNQTTIAARSGIAYNGLGQMVSYQDTITSTQTPGLTQTITFDASFADSYNDKGQLFHYSETKTETGLGLDVTTITTREAISYSDSGQMISYTETTDREGQAKTKITRSGITYNTLGQIQYYQDVITNLEGASV